MDKLLLISIKGKYVDEIVSGRKTIELRKSMPKVKEGDTVIIYTTQPKKAVTAIAVVKSILKLSPKKMWEDYNKKLGIDQKDYWNYYEGCQYAIGIELESVSELDTEILLSAIKLIHPGFTPPQTFKYLSKFQTLRDYKSIKTSHSN